MEVPTQIVQLNGSLMQIAEAGRDRIEKWLEWLGMAASLRDKLGDADPYVFFSITYSICASRGLTPVSSHDAYPVNLKSSIDSPYPHCELLFPASVGTAR